MKNISKILLIVILAVVTNSCNSDFLNTTPADSLSETAVWSDPILVELFVNEMYRGIGHGHHECELGSMTDESHFIHNYGTNQVVASIITPSDIGQWGSGNQNAYRWEKVYTYLRNANMFMENIDDVPFTDEALRSRLKGEVHFLIAFYYHNLVRTHGGVPIITKTFLLDDEFEVPRNSLKECVDYIVENCDKADALLPVKQEGANLGRANKSGALAIKSRILLWAASDLVHVNWYGSYEQPDLVTIGGDRTAAWTAAKNAAKAVIDLDGGVFSLENATGDPFTDYTALFIKKSSPEHIFSRYFIKSNGWDSEDSNTHSPLFNGPNGYAAWAGNTPIQALVDDYEMTDGTRFDWDNPEHAAAPYENRDPRFSASILYDKAPWRQRPATLIANDPIGLISIRSVYAGTDKTSAKTAGLDTREGPQQTWNGGYTGYYLRKAIDITIDPEFVYDGANQEVPWTFFRLGEIYLNYAEACIELNQDGEAKKYLNMIRARVGMPDITETGDALRQRYRNERRIEMAFEQARYFDVRRWLIGPTTQNKNSTGIVIDEFSDGRVEYAVQEVGQIRGWDDKTNFLPILQDEMNRNTMLIQNP